MYKNIYLLNISLKREREREKRLPMQMQLQVAPHYDVYRTVSQQWCWYDLEFEPRHDKTNKVTVRPAKTQTSLGIRPVWSVSSRSAWRKLGSLATHWAHSEDSGQTGRMPRLICLLTGRTVILLVLSRGGSFVEVSSVICYSSTPSTPPPPNTHTLCLDCLSFISDTEHDCFYWKQIYVCVCVCVCVCVIHANAGSYGGQKSRTFLTSPVDHYFPAPLSDGIIAICFMPGFLCVYTDQTGMHCDIFAFFRGGET